MPATIEQVANKPFDFIVVGGGTAGLVVAARLSEDPSVSVLVLEAGQANLQDKGIRAVFFANHFGKPQYDWGFTTTPQKHAGDRSIYWARGKGLGGSSAINFFQYHRPTKSDIDSFEALGNPGWNWDLLKKYYKKAEGFVEPKVATDVISYDLKERGDNGPLVVAYPRTMSGFEDPYHEALKAFGINFVKEPFAGDTKGAWLTPVTINPETRVRSYSANMYYEPNASRPNLTVLTEAHVTKLVLSKGAGGLVTATGVRFVHSGKVHETNVTKEVVLSAGAIVSPQVLELSGIGDKDVLQKVGIEVNLELPGVENNVQEHLFNSSSYQVREDRADEFLTFDCLRDPEEQLKQQKLYETGKGVYGMSLVCMTYVPLPTISPNGDALQKALADGIKTGIDSGKYFPALQKQYRIQLQHMANKEPSCEVILSQTASAKPNLPEPSKKYVTLSALINHPFSRGSIHVKSKDPLEPPAIEPHYFEENYDLASLVEILKFQRRLVKTEPLKSILKEGDVNPGPQVQTDEEIAEWHKENFSTTFHTVGSCSMLPLQDGGVVDTNLKICLLVYNTTNIRVIDISIIPLHIGAHLQSAAYAIGELGADIIKGNVKL